MQTSPSRREENETGAYDCGSACRAFDDGSPGERRGAGAVGWQQPPRRHTGRCLAVLRPFAADLSRSQDILSPVGASTPTSLSPTAPPEPAAPSAGDISPKHVLPPPGSRWTLGPLLRRSGVPSRPLSLRPDEELGRRSPVSKDLRRALRRPTTRRCSACMKREARPHISGRASKTSGGWAVGNSPDRITTRCCSPDSRPICKSRQGRS